MINSEDTMTKSVFDALAALANAKLAPVTPYSFTAFAGAREIALPKPVDLNPVANYGGGLFTGKVTLWMWAYKTIAGVKTYTFKPLIRAIIPDPVKGAFSVTWTWTNATGPNAPEGYVIAIPVSQGVDAWAFAWQDIGLVETFTEDGSVSDPNWKIDFSYIQNITFGNPLFVDLPCGRGTWLKTLNLIHNDIFSNMDAFGGGKYTLNDDVKVSGPECVSVAPKCYLNISGKSVYKNLQFWYSPADSATGNQLSAEADMLAVYIGAQNGVNTFNWDVPVTINGVIRVLSQPAGQAPADWNLSASDPAITIHFNPAYNDDSLGLVTAFEFTFTNIQYTPGTPITLTCTPLGANSVYQSGIVGGGGARVDCVFSGTPTAQPQSGGTAIHPSGIACQIVSLAQTLTPITFTTGLGGVNVQEAHWRSYCNGVFIANTIASLGMMTYLDVDLPQYNPQYLPGTYPSSRRTPRDPANPVYMPSVGNKPALWPIFKDSDFVPDAVGTPPRPLTGSKAWQVLGTKFVHPATFTMAAAAGHVSIPRSFFVPLGTADVRFYADNPNCILLARANALPDQTHFDASATGGTWISLAESNHGFATNTTWFFAIYNPTANDLTANASYLIFDTLAAPEGSFFPLLNGPGNLPVPQPEGLSYQFDALGDPAQKRPIPLYGYCIFGLGISRKPGADNSQPLNVSVGIRANMSFEAEGDFQLLEQFTIPAGQHYVYEQRFWPVLGGTPLSMQCDEQVLLRPLVNFQPMMHSKFQPQTSGGQTIGFYCGAPFYDSQKGQSFPNGGNVSSLGVLLPLSAARYNDLEATLNAL